MSLTVFLGICILSCDFLLYALFQWIYGEKHREHARRAAARREKRRALSAKQAGHPRVLPFPEHTSRLRTGYF
jgi:Flp pilus assembly protein TadB